MLAGLLEAEADACKHMADPREAEADERERLAVLPQETADAATPSRACHVT
ncbi:hypothetical protein HEB94_004935 [Actinopolymorpha pittospori]|uniref:Uncharacterized protein n=1 Tax=Actinopolymorpha pittospori TaxID=648752 RepID=A0A927N0E6_9ACTN|nr:hypothetical protein [Actinopolymorpha pittospori]MBE1608087.1 hypothetical protein [Actinopolymorpha pittospori]